MCPDHADDRPGDDPDDRSDDALLDHVKVKKQLGTDRSILDHPAQASDQNLVVDVAGAGSAHAPVADRPLEDDLLTEGAGENKPPVAISDGQVYGG